MGTYTQGEAMGAKKPQMPPEQTAGPKPTNPPPPPKKFPEVDATVGLITGLNGEAATLACKTIQFLREHVAARGARIEELEAEMARLTVKCNLLLSSIVWNGDGYSWDPSFADYRQKPEDAVNAQVRALEKAEQENQT